MLTMKKIILPAFILISFFAFPLASHASYIIHLKNGGQYITDQYWKEDGQIKFIVSGGIMGIDKDTVRKIEKSNIDANGYYETIKPDKVSPQVDQTPEKAIKKETLPDTNVKKEKVDLKAYQNKMAKLKSDINKTLTRIKKANTTNDQSAKDEATEDNRRISDEMWKLTDELKEKNNGKLPDDWWEGVGREDPAIQ
jgi:hypothetical protein